MPASRENETQSGDRLMSAAKTDTGFYGNDTDLICVMPSGRIWLVERPDEGQDVFRELMELPKEVETYHDVLPRDFIEGHLMRIEAASGESV